MLHCVLEGIQTVRTHSLDRSFKASKAVGGLKRNISVKMAWDGVKRNGTGRNGMEWDRIKRDGWDAMRWVE